MNFTAAELLHVLELYQAIMRARPLEMGNREFSQCLINASRSLGKDLLDTPRSALTSSPKIKTVLELIARQTPANAKSISGDVLTAICDVKKQYVRKDNFSRPYLRNSLRPLGGDYSRITVIFGPAMGLGDQITFFQFLRKLIASCPQASVTIFTLYPNLWRHLLPQVRELSYRGRPLRPFLQLKLAGKREQQVKELVILADFDCFNFHRKIIPHTQSRDIVEIALGRRTAWLSRGTSPWIQFEEFFSEAVVNNYAILSRMSCRFFPDTNERDFWSALKTPSARACPTDRFRIFLNPFSSKKFPFQPEDWHRMLRRIRELLPSRLGMEVWVYPGLDATTQRYAEDICKPFADNPLMNVRSLEHVNGFSSFTPYSAIPSLVSALERTHLCLTVDTFAAHFVPLFGVPAIVITLAENREFWVPGQWSFHCLVDNVARSVPKLAAELLMVQAGHKRISPEEIEAGRALIAATRKASDYGIVEHSIVEIQEALLRFLQTSKTPAAYESQGRQWLLLWSQLTSAMKSEAVDLIGLEPYLFRWKECEFLKVLYLIADSAAMDRVDENHHGWKLRSMTKSQKSSIAYSSLPVNS